MPDRPADPRIVYGARCTWWDSIDKVATTGPGRSGLPCCPRCGGVLMEVAGLSAWWAGATTYEEKNPGYRAFLEWARGRCYPNFGDASAAYRAATGAPFGMNQEGLEVTACPDAGPHAAHAWKPNIVLAGPTVHQDRKWCDGVA